jgi:pilus assembly protein Flp/PilA
MTGERFGLTKLGIPKVNRRPAPVLKEAGVSPDGARCGLLFWPAPQGSLGWNGGIPMKSLAQKVQRFLVSEDGPTAVEYAVMLALIIIVCLTAISAVGSKTSTTFYNVSKSVGAVGS